MTLKLLAPEQLTRENLARFPLPSHDDCDGKDDRGRVLVIAGSREVPGAALLSGTAALRSGAGKLQLVTAQCSALHLALALPEALVAGFPETGTGGIAPGFVKNLIGRAERTDACLVGPGLVEEPPLGALILDLLNGCDDRAFVLDAGALTSLPAKTRFTRGGATVITPHAGEMASFLGVSRDSVTRDPLAAAQEASKLIAGTVVMKGKTTFIVSPGEPVWVNEHGNVGLATSGSGDVLAGIIAGLLARGAQPHHAALWAVFTHAEAGNRLAEHIGAVGYLARELLGEIPKVLHRQTPS